MLRVLAASGFKDSCAVLVEILEYVRIWLFCTLPNRADCAAVVRLILQSWVVVN
jgi:hypothetical protein